MRAAGARAASTVEVLATSARLHIVEMLSMPFMLIAAVVMPAVLLLVTLVPMGDPAPEPASRVLFGVLLTAFWSATVWGPASILRRDRRWGTLARSLTGVRDPRVVALGKGLGSGSLNVALTAATVAVTLLALRQPVALERPVWVAVGLATVIASGASVGLLVSTLSVLTRHGQQISSALMYPVFLLGGMLIPPDLLPWGVRWVSALISLRWLQEFLATAAVGDVRLAPLAWAAALTVGYAVLGALLFERVVARVRGEGTVEHF